MAVGISTINGTGRVRRCVESVRRASLCGQVEVSRIVVVDDGSSESKLRELRDLSKGLEFEFREHRRNLGISATWNHIIDALMDSPLVLVLNDDIQLRPRCLEMLYYFTRWHHGAWGTVSPWLAHRGEPTPLKITGCTPTVPQVALSPCGAAFLLRPPFWRAVGGFDETFKSFYEEVDFGLRLAQLGLWSYHLPTVGADHGWSETFIENAEMLKPEERMRDSRSYFRSKWGGDLPSAPRIQELFSYMAPHGVHWLSPDGPQDAMCEPIIWAECESAAPTIST